MVSHEAAGDPRPQWIPQALASILRPLWVTLAEGRLLWVRDRQKHHVDRLGYRVYLVCYGGKRKGRREEGEKEREAERGGGMEKTEGRSYLFRRETERRNTGWRRQEIHLSLQKGKVGSGQGLSLNGTGYPGDRTGQQIVTFPSLSYNKEAGS